MIAEIYTMDYSCMYVFKFWISTPISIIGSTFCMNFRNCFRRRDGERERESGKYMNEYQYFVYFCMLTRTVSQ